MPADRLLPQQEQPADQISDIHPLPAKPCQSAAKNRVLEDLLYLMAGVQRGFKGVQRRGLADTVDPETQGVHIATGGGVAGENDPQRVGKAWNVGRNLLRRQPGGHLHREGDQQHHVANHGRVKGVMSQPAVQLLGDDHGKGGTQYHHPPGCQGRNADGQQQAGQQRRVVGQNSGNILLAQLEDSGFGSPGG